TTPQDQVLLLDLVLKGAAEERAAAFLGTSPALCGLALDILSWQKLRTMIPALLPWGTRVANKTGRGARGRSDAGIVYRGEAPLFIIGAYTDRVPDTMPDGLPGFAAAFSTIATLSRACWDSIGR
ncbi:MAG TPA: serine hydrolase, partial [Acetobacteraceae bacterium]|nr:serine hydrolase [Acetobacteraceae bacterium]